MIDRIVYAWRWLTQVQVVACSKSGYVHQWWARDEADALDWMRLYRQRYTVAYGRRGKLLGGRQGV
jgi:hypothetical protein